MQRQFREVCIIASSVKRYSPQQLSFATLDPGEGFCFIAGRFDELENMLDVLMYLFQNYLDDYPDPDSDWESLQDKLLAVGFPSWEIEQALVWLDSLADQSKTLPATPQSYRIYIEAERAKLDQQCQGFLLVLEQNGILNSETRELIIDRVMALEADEIGLPQLKWIILMVLFNRPGQEEACAFLEDLVFDEIPIYLH